MTGPRKLDTRLQYLIKILREAERDVAVYVERLYPTKSRIDFELRRVRRSGVVLQHDRANRIAVVLDDKTRHKIRVPYVNIREEVSEHDL